MVLTEIRSAGEGIPLKGCRLQCLARNWEFLIAGSISQETFALLLSYMHLGH